MGSDHRAQFPTGHRKPGYLNGCRSARRCSITREDALPSRCFTTGDNPCVWEIATRALGIGVPRALLVGAFTNGDTWYKYLSITFQITLSSRFVSPRQNKEVQDGP